MTINIDPAKPSEFVQGLDAEITRIAGLERLPGNAAAIQLHFALTRDLDRSGLSQAELDLLAAGMDRVVREMFGLDPDLPMTGKVEA